MARFARRVPARRRPRIRPSTSPSLERQLPRARLDVDARRRGALARPQLPVRPGPARLGQDVAGSEDGDRADAGRPADRRHLAQPQGDPQPAATRSSARRASRVSRSRGVKKRRRNAETRFEGDCHRAAGGLEGRCLDPRATARRRHVLAALAARSSTRRLRHAVRRRGRAGVARRRDRDRHVRAQPRAARRPEPAAAGLAGRAARRGARVGAAAPAGRRTRRCRPIAGSSSSRRGGCGRSSARSPRTRTTRGGSYPWAALRGAFDRRARTGSRVLLVEHARTHSSRREEADAVAAEIERAARDAVHG